MDHPEIVPIIIALSLASCSPKVITSTQVQRDTLFVTFHSRDSVYFRDSVYIKEVIKGDTIRITEYRDRWRDRIREVHDTIYRSHTDTIAVETIITKEVEQPVRGWKKVRMRAFLPLLIAALVGWRKEIYRLFKKYI